MYLYFLISGSTEEADIPTEDTNDNDVRGDLLLPASGIRKTRAVETEP
jgi:hypothetical protein